MRTNATAIMGSVNSRKEVETDCREASDLRKTAEREPAAELSRRMSLNAGSTYLLRKLLTFQMIGSILPKKQIEITDD
jgi:hypothetical protein